MSPFTGSRSDRTHPTAPHTPQSHLLSSVRPTCYYSTTTALQQQQQQEQRNSYTIVTPPTIMSKIASFALPAIFTAAVGLLVSCPAQGQQWPYNGETFTGEGTYYGYTTQGNCAIREPIPGMYEGMTPVALNKPMYGDSLLCGACIEGTSNGEGSGSNPIPSTFKAYVTDKCPECAWGDLDFSMSGDGRWDIEWNFVECPSGSGDPTFLFEGSNPWYWKLQPRGTKTPVEELYVGKKIAQRTDDNFFVVSAGSPFNGAQEVDMKTIGGEDKKTMVSL